jgi:2,5-diketo-D-gluconate reductase A
MDKNSRIKLSTGREMPVMGLGTWQMSLAPAWTIEHAFELGYRMVDTSGDYGTQPAVGEAIATSNLPREDIFVVTKVEETDDAYEATARNLEELGLDYVDLMLIHRPPPAGAGEHLWAGLIRAQQEGLARDIGVSNYTIEQMSRLYDGSGEVPVVNQVEWTPFGWSPQMLDFCNEQHIAIMAYSPLTRGNRLDDDRLVDIADEYVKSPAQVLLKWDHQHGVVPIPKANHREHLQENIDSFDFEISEADMQELDNLNMLASSLADRIAYA